MTESDARQIVEMYLSRYNPTYWDGSGEVPSEANFDICRVAVDSMYEGCTLEIQLCRPDACPCYAASIHLFEGGFWTGFGVGSFNKTALCYDIGSASALASAIMRICATYENLTNFRKVFVERLVISKERMNVFKISIISFTASALHPNLKTLWSSWKTLSFPTTNRSSMWLQTVWKLWGFQSRRVITTRTTSPPLMCQSSLSASITLF